MLKASRIPLSGQNMCGVNQRSEPVLSDLGSRFSPDLPYFNLTLDNRNFVEPFFFLSGINSG